MQREQDQAEQNEQARIDRESEELRQAQQEKEAEELRKEAEKKKPKISNFDRSRIGPGWIEPRPAEYALNKLDSLEYVELDYFTIKGCSDADSDMGRSTSGDTLTFAQLGDTITLRPLNAQRPSRRIRNDEDLSWEEMLDAKNMMLRFMEKSGLWPAPHAEAIAGFFLNIELHPRKVQPNGKKALLVYQSRVQCEWFSALKRGDGYNIEIIQEEYLHLTADEVNDAVRNRDSMIKDRETAEHVRNPLPLFSG